MKLNKYTVYLLKPDVIDPDYALTQKALDMIPKNAAEFLHLEDHEYDNARAVIFFNDPAPPKWSTKFSGILELPDDVYTSNSGAIYFAQEWNNWFAITFGTGHYYLDKRKVLMDFGLRAAINMLDDDSVKTREGFEIAKSQRGASQSASGTAFSELGNSGSVEIVKSISGRIEKQGTVSGSVSLKFVSSKALSNLSEDLYGSIKAYGSPSYKTTSFSVIDQLRPIKDKDYISKLDEQLIDAIDVDSGEIELVIPQVVSHDRDVSYVRLLRTGMSPPPEFVEISITSFISALASSSVVDIEALKKITVEAFDAEGSYVNRDSAYKCLVGTVESDISGTAQKYVINEGEWYAVSQKFKDKIDQFFDQVRDVALDGEFAKLKIIDVTFNGKKQKIGYETELDYNTRIAADANYELMDQEMVKVPGMAGRGFEFCDILDVSNKRLIHVKKGSTQSSVLSHFFNQGVTPLTYYASDLEFRDAVHEKIKSVSPTAAQEFMGHKLADYSVHFLIVDSRRADGTFNVPFFSRITLYDRAKNISAYVNKATVSFVEPEVVP